MKIIQLTSISPTKPGASPMFAYFNIEAIEVIYQGDGETTIGIKSHNNGGYRCRESAKEVMMLIAHAKELGGTV